MGAVRDRMIRAAAAAGLVRPSAALEVRDPRAATSRFAGYSVDAWQKPMIPEWDADSALKWAYYANIVVYRCVQITAQALASMAFRAGADPDKPGDHNPKARLSELLGPPPLGPAPKLSARRLWQWSIAQYLVTGRMCWELELGGPGYGNLDIVNLWPLVSAKVGAIPTTQGTDWFRAFTYNYGSSTPRNLAPEQMFYAWRPAAGDFRQPESVLQAARLDVSIAVMQDRYDYAFLRNDARPATIVVHERFAETSMRDAFREQFRADYQGPDNAGKAMFLEAGDPDEESSMDVRNSIFVQALGLSQRDAEFVERHKQKLTDICIAFGTPVSKLGDASDRTFSNAKDENRNWWRDTIHPLAVEIQDEVNLQLAPRLDGGRYVGWFDTSTVPELRPEPFWQPEPLSNLVGVLISEGEGRTLIGLPEELPDNFEKKAPPIQPILAAHMAAAAGLPAAGEPSPSPAKPPSEPVVAPAKPARGTATITDIRDAIRDGVDLIPAVEVRSVESRVAHAERRSLEARQALDHMDTLEIAWREEFRRLFRQQKANTLAKLRGRRGSTAVRKAAAEGRDTLSEGAFDLTHWNGVVFDAASSLYRQTALLAARRLNGRPVRALAVDLPDPFDPDAPPVVQYIQSRANQLAGQVNGTTYQQIKDELSDGVAAGETIDDLADRVAGVFDDASDVRATTIARTECLPGSAVVDGADATAVYRRWYEGAWIKVRTAAGREFSGTPNHPVLTNRGWVGLGHLTEGDHLLCHRLGVEQPGSPANEDVAAPPATIAEVFDAAAAVVVPERMAAGEPDFHGDGRDGYVDVLRPDRVLSLGSFTPITERLVDGVLAPSDMTDVVLAALCAPFRRDVPIDQVSRLTRTPGGMAGELHPSLDHSGADADLLGQRLGRLAGQVTLHDFLAVEIEALARVIAGPIEHASRLGQRSGDARLAENPRDRRGTHTELPLDLSSTQAGSVELDHVIAVEVRQWRGHVFNLTTVDGYFVANGVYTGNTVSAYNAVTDTIFDQYGPDVAAGKEWLSTIDGRTRDDHAEADGQQVGPDEQFQVGGESCDYPGDPNLSPEQSCNCRCTLLVLTPEEMGVGSDGGRQRRPRVIPLEAAERAAIRLALEQGA